jgi:hypothetical protein
MPNEQENRCRTRGRWPGRLAAPALLLSVSVATLPSCQTARGPDGRADNGIVPVAFGAGTLQGDVTVREGDTIEVRYKTPFQTPPRLVLVELRGSNARETYYSKDDFQIVRQGTTSFTVRNNHAEHGESWATVRWRAEGEPSKDANARGNGLAAVQGGQEVLIESIKLVGGKATVDPNLARDDDVAPRLASREGGKNAVDGTLTSSANPVGPPPGRNTIATIDLHRTRVGDADVAALAGLTNLRTLNLYGTKVTDAGLASLSSLAGLQTLYLNDTAVTDAGLQSLQGLTKLGELGLSRTRVTDAGLATLRGFPNLHSLSLNGTQVSDAGLEQLRGMRNLKRLYLGQTRVSAAGIQDLKRSLPSTQIFK